jgi:hypothetical protein
MARGCDRLRPTCRLLRSCDSKSRDAFFGTATASLCCKAWLHQRLGDKMGLNGRAREEPGEVYFPARTANLPDRDAARAGPCQAHRTTRCVKCVRRVPTAWSLRKRLTHVREPKMLKLQLKQLGKLLIPLAIGAWGLFALVRGGQYGGHLDEIPREMWLLGLVLGTACVAAAIAWLWLRARAPDDSRW